MFRKVNYLYMEPWYVVGANSFSQLGISPEARWYSGNWLSCQDCYHVPEINLYHFQRLKM